MHRPLQSPTLRRLMGPTNKPRSKQFRANQKWPRAIAALVVLLLVNSVGCLRNHRNVICMRRGDESNSRVETLKRTAHQSLKIGTGKDAVIRFFAESAIPVTFGRNEASGSIHVLGGCAPRGCGTNRMILGLRVGVDETGTVVSEPTVVTLFEDCV